MNLNTINKDTLGLILHHVEPKDICNLRLVNKGIKKNIDRLDNPKRGFETRPLEKKLSTEQWIKKKTQQYCPAGYLPLWYKIQAFWQKHFKPIFFILLIPISFIASILNPPISVVGVGTFIVSVGVSYFCFLGCIFLSCVFVLLPMMEVSDSLLEKRGSCMLRDFLNNDNLLTHLKSEYDNLVHDEKKISFKYSIFKFEQTIIKSINKEFKDKTDVLLQVEKKEISFDEAATIMKDRTHAFPVIYFTDQLAKALHNMKKQKLNVDNLSAFKNNLKKALKL